MARGGIEPPFFTRLIYGKIIEFIRCKPALA
nr:MAG TPA: hypothetical protein [Caudoviricetes sp.]